MTARSASIGARVTARAGTNIALCKYWGKRDAALNLPAVGSLSLTLAEMGSKTSVRFLREAGPDRFVLDGRPVAEPVLRRTSAFLDRVRARAGLSVAAEVESTNDVPTAAGLASSASGFAALALAATRAAGLDLDGGELSELARLGSGSAARSIFGGFVEMARGQRADGRDAVARPLPEGDGWPVRLVVAVIDESTKAVASTLGMDHTAATSPYHAAWVAGAEADLAEARAAIAARDLARLGEVSEWSCLKMHAAAMAARPGVVYFAPVTLAAIAAVKAARAAGVGAWFTVDAGPNVKALCLDADAPRVAAHLGAVSGVVRTVICSPGPGARIVDEASHG